ncbi:MAG TPA: GNAT family N-acetyltransferase [Capsulimonadaceae bacterium]|nr:GNAT family N-acetyltransferase [Capsulimonadaceae bacterium]
MQEVPPEYVLSDTSQMSIEQLAKVTNATFQGYFVLVNHTAQTFAGACRAWSLDVAQSVVLEKKDGRLVGLAMLGIRADRGWCGGFGILPRYRGRGLARFLAQGLIEKARNLGLKSLQLECFVENTPAVRVYLNAGLRIIRNVATLTADLEMLSRKLQQGSSPFLDVNEAAAAEGLYTALQLGADSAILPTWQREPACIYTMSDLGCLIAGSRSNPRGVLVYRSTPASNHVNIVLFSYNNEHVARSLLKRAAWDASPMHREGKEKVTQVSLLNEPEDSPFNKLGNELGFTQTYRQHEMMIDL